MDTPGQVDALLARKSALAARVAEQPQFAARLEELRAWQAARLAQTYDDLRRDPQYSLAVEFFLHDLYGPQDMTPRDRDLRRAWSLLKRTLPAAALAALGRAIELEVLSGELDQLMVEVLPEGAVTATEYARAYRAVGRGDLREHQIDLVAGVGKDLERVVRHAWIGTLLQLARGPAHAAGYGVLQDFIERGFAAFQNMKDAPHFLRTIRERELGLMEALLAGAGAEALDAARRDTHA